MCWLSQGDGIGEKGELCRRCGVECGTVACNGRRVSVRKGTMFERFRMDLQSFVVAVYEWSRSSTVESICTDAGLGYVTCLGSLRFCV